MSNISPNVYTKIIDLSSYIDQIPSTIGFICVLAKKGPDNIVYFLDGQEELITKFGYPNIEDFGKDYSQGLYIANNFIKESGALYIVRCMPDDSSFSNLKLSINDYEIPRLSLTNINNLNSESIIINNLENGIIEAPGAGEDPGFPPPVIITQPENTEIYEREIASLYIEAVGENILYQWFYRKNQYEDFIEIPSEIFPSSITNELATGGAVYGDEGQTGYYKCKVYNETDFIYSNEVFVEILRRPPEIIDFSYDYYDEEFDIYYLYFYRWGNAYFWVDADGIGLSYQWYENDVEILGATSYEYIINSISWSETRIYKCKVYNDAGEVFTNPIYLEIVLT